MNAKAEMKETDDSILNVMKKSIAPRVRELRFSLYLMRKSLLAMVGLAIVLAIVLIALAAPLLAPPVSDEADPFEIPLDFEKQFAPPGFDGYPLGAGKYGVDIYYGIVWGARTSITVAMFVVGVAAMVGIVLGALAGYYGGAIDELLMRITDVFLSIPGLILAMAVVSVLERNLENIMLALIVVWWPPYARIVRGQVLSVRENTYVEAAWAVGAKNNRVLFKHVIPNSLAPMLVSATMDLGAVVLVAAGLSYIGFGSAPNTAEWGRMISDGQEFFLSQIEYPRGSGDLYNPWWAVTFPGIAIFMFVMGFNLLGDGLRDILDPRLRR
jgi:peptide/nickel transport system permease protein